MLYIMIYPRKSSRAVLKQKFVFWLKQYIYIILTLPCLLTRRKTPQSGRVYYGKKTEALPTPGSDGAAEPHHTSPEGIIPQKSYVRNFVIGGGGVVVFAIAAIITCVCLVVFMTPPGPLSNSTLSNSTEDPLVTLDFDEVGGGGGVLF